MSITRAVIITIGDELLIGQTIDTNSAWIATECNALGIDILRRVAVGDAADAIINAIDEELPRTDILFLTGGLGPTSDDITKPLLCNYFGGKLRVDERVLTHVKELFAKRNRPLLPANLKQAEVPDNCTVLFNSVGTAPGMWFEHKGKVIISLPGVPNEMKHIMESEALPRIKERFISDAIVHRTLFTAGEGESFIAQKLEQFEAELPTTVKLAYLPDSGFVRLRLTSHGSNKELLEEQLTLLQQQMVGLLGNIVIANEDIPIQEVLGNLLCSLGKTVSLAESCTGGAIGNYLTNTSGASAYFNGSIVAYDNLVKINVLGVSADIISEYGAVSEETVKAMAQSAIDLFKTDYAIAVSGVLGPQGGTERVSVGTVWIAVTDKENTTAKKFHFHYDRERNKEMAARNAMLYLYKFIKNQLS